MRNISGPVLALVFAAASVPAAEPAPAPFDPAASGASAGDAREESKTPALALGAAEWLLKVSESSRHASYQGVVVYRDSETMETLRIVHRHKDGREQERLTSMSGAPRDTVRDNEHVSCALAHDHTAETAASVQNLLPALSSRILQQVAPYYAFRDLGGARVAGRDSRGVAIEPRDEFRYGYAVWADQQTAVALKVSLLDREGRMIEQMLYTEIQFPALIADSAFAVRMGVHNPPAAPAASQITQIPQIAGSSVWTMVELPPGFQMVMRSLKPVPESDGVVEHVLLSDGLSAVSVFSARGAQHHKLFHGFSHMGAMNAYGRRLGVFHVTVVGEVPQATVRLIGDGLTAAQ